MVSTVTRFSLAAAFGLCLVSPLPAKELADYRIGDAAQEDIVAPVQLVVIDADRTAALKYEAGQKIPIVFRYYPNTVDEVENDFRSAFVTTRSNFINTVETTFHQAKLDENTVAQPEFQRFVSLSQRQDRMFPLSTNLAVLWALGDPGDAVQSNYAARLRAMMEHPVRNGTPDEEFKHGGQVRLVPVTNRDEMLTLEMIEQRGRNITRSNALILARARADFQQTAAPEESAFARFAASFLKPNCLLEVDLTRQYRAKHTEQLHAADTYERGQVIVRRGQIIDKKLMAALDQLREKTQVGELRQQVTEQKTEALQSGERNRWLLIGLAGVTAILVLVIWRLGRRPQPSSLPAMLGDADPAMASALPEGSEPPALPENAGADSWQQRAVEAEQRAEKAQAALRSGLLPHLTRLLKTWLLQGLISQRASMLDTQQKAADDIAELDRKLDELHTPLQERLRAYEKRIGELERDLAQKGEENRELLKAKIFMTRKHLQAERSRNPLDLN